MPSLSLILSIGAGTVLGLVGACLLLIIAAVIVDGILSARRKRLEASHPDPLELPHWLNESSSEEELIRFQQELEAWLDKLEREQRNDK